MFLKLVRLNDNNFAAIKQESNEPVSLFTGDYEAKSTQSPVLVRTPFRQPSVSGDRDSNSQQNNSQQIVEKAKQVKTLS